MTDLRKRTSIIILSYNTLEYTKLCLESVRTCTVSGSYELIVVDNGSTDGSAEWLQEQDDIILQCNAENRGFPGGCNQGMRLATGDALLLLNSDTIVTPHWLENLRRALDSEPRIGAVGCVTNYCSNLQTIPVNYDTIEKMMSFAERYNHSNPELWRPWLRLVGFCFLWKRSIYARLGGFDERFNPGNYEDDDLSLRIRKAGYELLLCQDTFIHHFGSQSFRGDFFETRVQKKQQEYHQLLVRNFQYLQEKWQFVSDYRRTHSVADSLPPNMPAGTRVCIVNCGYGQDIFFLASSQPQIVISGVALHPEEQQMAAVSFPIGYARDLLQAADCILEPQDVIVLIGNRQDFPEFDQALRKFVRKLAEHGDLYYSDTDKILCASVGK